MVLTLIFSIILSLSGMAYLYLTSIERIFQAEQTDRTLSFYAAEAGVERAYSWIMNLVGYPEAVFGPNSVYYPFGNNEIYLNTQPKNSSYIVAIYPDQSNNPSLPVESYYTISSTGTAGNIIKCVTRRVKIINLLKFAYFSNIENAAYFVKPDRITGFVHSNDWCYISGTPQFSDIDSNGILDINTSKGFRYYNDSNAIPLHEANHKTNKISLTGKFNLDRLRNIAVQMQSVGNGLVLSGNQNLVINGNVLVYGSNTWNIPISSAIVFVNGNINISGNNLQRWLTIVSSYSITITDSIRYRESPKGMLALIANNNIMVSSLVPNTTNHVYIDGILVALNGRFYAEDWNTRYALPGEVGYLHIFGSLIQNESYYVSQPSTDIYANETASGYHKDYRYDNRVLSKPPPFFPNSLMSSSIEWRELPSKRK